MTSISPIDYPSIFDALSREKLNWDETGIRKKDVSRLKKHIKAALRRKFSQTCFFCGESVAEGNSYYDIEHILPKSNERYSNFVFNPKNLVLSCEVCNRLKGSVDVLSEDETSANITYLYDDYPLESSNYQIIHPYLDDYNDHIKISEIFYLVQNNSLKGINTIKFYHLARLSLAESKIKSISKFNSPVIQRIVNGGSIEMSKVSYSATATNNESSYNSHDATNLIDRYLNSENSSDRTLNRINKIKEINGSNFKDFIEFRKIVNELNNISPSWYDESNWYDEVKYITVIESNICFNNTPDKTIPINHINNVLTGLKALCGTTDLREGLENVEIKDIYYTISTFRSFLNNESYCNNHQLELLLPLRYSIECLSWYEYTDFVNDIVNLILIDIRIIKGIEKIFKIKNKNTIL